MHGITKKDALHCHLMGRSRRVVDTRGPVEGRIIGKTTDLGKLMQEKFGLD